MAATSQEGSGIQACCLGDDSGSDYGMGREIIQRACTPTANGIVGINHVLSTLGLLSLLFKEAEVLLIKNAM